MAVVCSVGLPGDARTGALEMYDKKAKSVMTKFEDIKMLEIDRTLDIDTLAEVTITMRVILVVMVER